MKNKRNRLLVGSVVLLGLCLAALKMQVLQVVYAEVQDVMSDTITIQYDTSRLGGKKVSISPDIKQMAFCKGTQEFFVQELSTNKITIYPTHDKVYQVKYSPDGKYLVAGCNVVNLQTGQIRQLATDGLLISHLGEVIAFSSDSESVAIISEQPGMNPRPYTIEIWNLQTQQLVQTLPIQEYYRSSTGYGSHTAEMSFSKDDRYLAVAGTTITIWGIQEGKCIKTLVSMSKLEYKSLPHNTQYTTITYSPDGKYLAAGVVSTYIKQGERAIQENFIEIWDVEQDEVINTLDWDKHITGRLRYSPDGQYLASGRTVGRNDNIRDVAWIWNVNNWQVVQKLTQFPDDHIKAMDYSADGSYLSVSGLWHTKIWKIK